MAFDKVIDSAVLDANLTTVADAIRAKGGTTEPLSFPDGFVSAVEGIQSGGGDNVARSIADRSITEFRDSTITKIGSNAFRDCSKLAVLDTPNVTEVYGYFAAMTALTTLTFPKLSMCSYNSFENCQQLEKLDLSVCNMIYGTSLRYCNKLKTLVLRRTGNVVTLVGTNAFSNTPFEGYNGESGTVYVPQALVESYKTATNWSTLYAKGTCNFVAIEGSEYE